MALAAVNSTLSGILNGIAKAALQQSPPDQDTFMDIQSFLDNAAGWPAYTVTATTSTTGPLVYWNEIAGNNAGVCGVYPAQLVSDSVTATVKQAGTLDPKTLGV